MYRKVVGVSGIYVCAYIRSDEKSLVKEDSFIFRCAVWRRTFGVKVVEMQVGDLAPVCPAAERPDKAMRHACNAAEVNMGV